MKANNLQKLSAERFLPPEPHSFTRSARINPSDIASKESTKTSEPKKDKSGNRRKSGTLVEYSEMASAISKYEATSQSTIMSQAVQASTSEHEAPQKSSKITKINRERNKRKASALIESTYSETATLEAAPQSFPNSSYDASHEPPSKKSKASVEEIEINVNAPEPPSKKALRRLKKGKPLSPSKSGAEPTPERELKKEKKTEVEERSEHGVWIGNLPWSVSKEILRGFLVDFSDITSEMITRVHMPSPNDAKSANKVEEKKFGKAVHNKGFAYVDFSTSEAVDMAVELSEQLLSGRRLLIKNHKSFEGRPERTKEESRNDGKPPNRRIFLGNLSYDVTEEILKAHFEKCGAVESVKVATFEDSGKCKGFAWIVFEELEAAQNAVRGFVYIDEEVSDTSEPDEEEKNVSQVKPKITKKRKWWINKIKGRPLRMEFAEGAEVRYKKRYGKDGTKNANVGGREASGEGVKENSISARPIKVVEYRQSYAPRLTGSIVESKGKKVTF